MLFLLFLFGVAVGTTTPAEDHPVPLLRGGCPPFWFSFNDRCYRYMSVEMTWIDAELHCRSQGSTLVSIHSTQEQNFIRYLIRNFDHSGKAHWIGYSDIHKEGWWMWSDSSANDFKFWADGEPNNGNGNEHCAHTGHDAMMKWNDHRCSLSFPFVCATRLGC